MNPNEIYFQRTEGEWSWLAHFSLLSWRALWTSSISFGNKLRVTLMILSQNLFGRFAMWTRVSLLKERGLVQHSLELKKWGIIFYHSEKIFRLDPDGHDLQLEGEDAYWPLLIRKSKFSGLSGRVLGSTTEAVYQMPLFGCAFDCRTFLGPDQGFIHFETTWMHAEFVLDQPSQAILKSRLSNLQR
jgi:hypothetical protein